MTKVVYFKPRSELDAQGNLDAFISFVRDELIFDNFDFDSNVWDFTKLLEVKGKGGQAHRVYFSKHHSVLKSKKEIVPFSDNFLSFAKAYLLHFYVQNKVQNFARLLEALRMLEIALLEYSEEASVVSLSTDILNRAANLLKKNYKAKPAYGAGGHLEKIARFLLEKNMLSVPFQWKSPNARPKELSIRCGKEAEEHRENKMPSEQMLKAIPYVYHNAKTERQILVSSVAAILCAAPDRISEVTILPKDCEVVGYGTDDDAYGLGWKPSKGGKPMVKWQLTSMIETVKDAIRRIREVTEPARKIAEWYYENENQVYLQPDFEYLRELEHITYLDVAHILWGERGISKSASYWCKQRGIERKKIENRFHVRFSDVEKHIMEKQYVHFPFVDNTKQLYLHDSLLLSFRGVMGKKLAYACYVEPITIGQINDGLGARSKHGIKSIFDEFDLAESDGSHLEATTHMFRHYVDMVLRMSGASELEIAKVSGRKKIQDNAAYDHTQRKDYLAKIQDAVADSSKSIGPISYKPKKKNFINRSEFAELEVATVHATDIGYCIRNFLLSPCIKLMDCINCNEHVYIKGDHEKEVNIRKQLQEASKLLKLALQEVERRKENTAQVKDQIDRWVDHHNHTVTLLEKLIGLIDDPTIPLGTVIQLDDIRPDSRLEAGGARKLAGPKSLAT